MFKYGFFGGGSIYVSEHVEKKNVIHVDCYTVILNNSKKFFSLFLFFVVFFKKRQTRTTICKRYDEFLSALVYIMKKDVHQKILIMECWQLDMVNKDLNLTGL